MDIEFVEKPTAHNFKDLTGDVYGRLTVLGYAGKRHGRTSWWCECECGNVVKVTGNGMRRGNTSSCGCLMLEVVSQLNKTHGRRHTGEYSSWAAMKTRCTNPNSQDWEHYGGRGIKVCDRWLNSFEAYFEDMGPRPEGHTLERLDSDGDYEPGNVVWASQQEQVNNTSQNRRLTFKGKKRTISQWARITGIERRTIARRLGLGWSVERALTEKPIVGKNQYSD